MCIRDRGNGDSQHNPITNTFYRGINQLLLNYKYDDIEINDEDIDSEQFFSLKEVGVTNE